MCRAGSGLPTLRASSPAGCRGTDPSNTDGNVSPSSGTLGCLVRAGFGQQVARRPAERGSRSTPCRGTETHGRTRCVYPAATSHMHQHSSVEQRLEAGSTNPKGWGHEPATASGLSLPRARRPRDRPASAGGFAGDRSGLASVSLSCTPTSVACAGTALAVVSRAIVEAGACACWSNGDRPVQRIGRSRANLRQEGCLAGAATRLPSRTHAVRSGVTARRQRPRRRGTAIDEGILRRDQALRESLPAHHDRTSVHRGGGNRATQ